MNRSWGAVTLSRETGRAWGRAEYRPTGAGEDEKSIQHDYLKKVESARSEIPAAEKLMAK
jgi:hypothetical protein